MGEGDSHTPAPYAPRAGPRCRGSARGEACGNRARGGHDGSGKLPVQAPESLLVVPEEVGGLGRHPRLPGLFCPERGRERGDQRAGVRRRLGRYRLDLRVLLVRVSPAVPDGSVGRGRGLAQRRSLRTASGWVAWLAGPGIGGSGYCETEPGKGNTTGSPASTCWINLTGEYRWPRVGSTGDANLVPSPQQTEHEAMIERLVIGDVEEPDRPYPRSTDSRCGRIGRASNATRDVPCSPPPGGAGSAHA